VAGYNQPVMVGGAVEYKRKYTLWVLILLVILCWPAAILYYFTRDKVPVQEMRTYAAPMQSPYPSAPSPVPGASTRFCPACGAQNPATGGFCARCGKPLA